MNLPRRKLRRGAAVPKEAIARGVRAEREQRSGGSDARRVLRGRSDGRDARAGLEAHERRRRDAGVRASGAEAELPFRCAPPGQQRAAGQDRGVPVPPPTATEFWSCKSCCVVLIRY